VSKHAGRIRPPIFDRRNEEETQEGRGKLTPAGVVHHLVPESTTTTHPAGTGRENKLNNKRKLTNVGLVQQGG